MNTINTVIWGKICFTLFNTRLDWSVTDMELLVWHFCGQQALTCIMCSLQLSWLSFRNEISWPSNNIAWSRPIHYTAHYDSSRYTSDHGSLLNIHHLSCVICHRRSWAEHHHLKSVLQALQAAALTASPSKCSMAQEEGNYLGYTVGSRNVKPQSKKKESMLTWPQPQTKKQILPWASGLLLNIHPWPQKQPPLSELVCISQKQCNLCCYEHSSMSWWFLKP